ncbi:hypothetical protein ABKN59_008713 [Abortiporus biennis]
MTSAGLDPSPVASPSLGPQRRLSARRGSISASDPWGAHASVNLNPTRSTSSRLTIVRVPPQTETEDRRHRRHGSNASVSSTSSKGDAGRLSFAFTTFTPPGSSATGGRPSSPSSPRLRPASPSSPHRQSVNLPQHAPKLSPEQLVELARQSCNPRPVTSNGAVVQASIAPVSFTPLPDSIYLPFIERPAEVSALISQQPSAKLFALLAQTFPSNARERASSTSTIPSVDSDPKKWSYAELENWLKMVDRDQADDVTWVRKARECILSHSELIWERIKGALGVPPELNVEDDELPLYLQPRFQHLRNAIESSATAASGKSDESALEDTDVFEPDSPTSPLLTVDNPEEPVDLVEDDDHVSVEQVIASPVPPTATSNPHSLQEVTEEEEEEEEEEGDTSEAKPSASSLEEPDIRGLRFSTSPSAPGLSMAAAISPGSAASSLGGGSGNSSPVIRTRGIPLQDDEGSVGSSSYDPMKERGPGRPLFPSSFAQLGTGPLMSSYRTSARTHSFSSAQKPSGISGLHRSGSLGGHSSSSPIAIAGRSGAIATASGIESRMTRMGILPPRSEWPTDMSKHEYAISASSVE